MSSAGKAHALKFVTDAIYGDHLRGLGHPESPDRVEVVAARLRGGGLLDDTIAARDASDDELRRVHSPAYLELLAREIGGLRQPRYLSTGDVVVDAASLRVARRAAGGAIAAVEACVTGREAVFALLRPPGHHAEPDRGMGFCLLNNAAVAARAYQAATGRRVLVIDFDYHHGNGTQAAAGNGLSYVSTHAFPAYPGSGRTSYRLGDDVVANVPLPVSGVSTEAFVAVWEELLARAAAAVKPALLVVSAGFDFVAGDPVGDLGVAVEAAEALAAAINAVAGRFCEGRVAYILEGGYNLDALTHSIAGIAAATDRADLGPSGAQAASAPDSVRRCLAQLSAIFQGGEPPVTN